MRRTPPYSVSIKSCPPSRDLIVPVRRSPFLSQTVSDHAVVAHAINSAARARWRHPLTRANCRKIKARKEKACTCKKDCGWAMGIVEETLARHTGGYTA